MKISLIAPAFNEEKYIGKFLESICRQSQIPDEVIICDNGSTDDTVAEINKYFSLLPLKIVAEKQKGISFAVETAWKSATGDLILKTDSDCILPKKWVEKHLDHYLNNGNLSACGGGFTASDGNIFIKFLTPIASYLDHLFLHLTHGHRVIFGGNMSIKRTVLEQIGGYQNNPQKIQDDILISHRLFQNKHQYTYFPDLNIATSTRRFSSLKDLLFSFLSIFNPKFYLEKTS